VNLKERTSVVHRRRIGQPPFHRLISMTRQRWFILGASLLLLTVGAELGVRSWNALKGSVQVANQGENTMDDVIVTYGNTRVAVGTLAAGQSTNVWLTAAGKGTLSLDFKQKGNPLNGFHVPDFDPIENLANGLKLVLIVKDNRVERFMDDEQPSSSPWKNLVDIVTGWFEPENPSMR
jgi:hypothetical protein